MFSLSEQTFNLSPPAELPRLSDCFPIYPPTAHGRNRPNANAAPRLNRSN
jgi:hypothetical protein